MTEEKFSRRAMLGFGAAAIAGGLLTARQSGAHATGLRFAVNHTPAEWQRMLGSNRYHVLREAGTERAYTSPLLNEHRRGTFTCAGCALALFSSVTKFESGTGWPSFYQPLASAVETRTDRSLFMTRTEVHCSRCLGHLGHVFDDGPPPTGLRYCMNGVALKFAPQAGSSS